jgi:hypothetical protein
LTFDNDSARSALTEAAAKLGTAESEVVAEGIEERSSGVEVQGVGLTVDLQGDYAHTARVRGKTGSVKPEAWTPGPAWTNPGFAGRILKGSPQLVLWLFEPPDGAAERLGCTVWGGRIVAPTFGFRWLNRKVHIKVVAEMLLGCQPLVDEVTYLRRNISILVSERAEANRVRGHKGASRCHIH